MGISSLKAAFAAAIAGALSLSAASAADLARPYTKAPPLIEPVWSWTGFYVGANGGYSWGRSRTDASFFNTVTGVPVVLPAGSVTSSGFDMNGGVAGGQAGYNWQTNNWVWGLEADIQWSGEKGRTSYLCSATLIGGPCLPGLTFLPPGVTGTTLTLDQNLQWFGTVRGRAGILATPQVLLYATGGLAYGSIKTTGTLAGTTGILVIGPVGSVGSTTDTRVGWTVGAGIEGKITRDWSAKLEYLYMDLGRFDSGPFSLAPASTIGVNVSSRFTDHILRAGINYQFSGPVIAKY
jgi:outer membrane immunogenic protein